MTSIAEDFLQTTPHGVRNQIGCDARIAVVSDAHETTPLASRLFAELGQAAQEGLKAMASRVLDHLSYRNRSGAFFGLGRDAGAESVFGLRFAGIFVEFRQFMPRFG